MPNLIQSSGKYTVKETGESVNYDFEFQAFENIDDALESLGEAQCLKLIQRMVKVDANNTAREKAKTANGHSTRPVMSEEDKARKKAERQATKQAVDVLKGKSREELEAIGIPDAVIEAMGL